MRVTVERDGRSTTVDVPPGGGEVVLGGQRYPVTIVRSEATLVELEIAGERVVVENWPEHFPEPPGPVDVNGERWTIAIERGLEHPGAPGSPRAPVSAATSPPAVPKPPTRAGTPIVPPMPGKVIELRVAEGDRVAAGDVLLVLEAMKMRNEITSPVAGVVRGLAVVAGANARAKEPMLFVAAEGPPASDAQAK